MPFYDPVENTTNRILASRVPGAGLIAPRRRTIAGKIAGARLCRRALRRDVRWSATARRLLVNEIAPRVHNSGTGPSTPAVTSQFEQHIRAIAGWPLGRPRATAMR